MIRQPTTLERFAVGTARTLAPIALDRIDLAEVITIPAPATGGFVTGVFGGVLDGQRFKTSDVDAALACHRRIVDRVMKATERRPGS